MRNKSLILNLLFLLCIAVACGQKGESNSQKVTIADTTETITLDTDSVPADPNMHHSTWNFRKALKNPLAVETLSLSLSSNQNDTLLPYLSKFKNLKQLKIYGSRTPDKFPEQILELTHLEHLHFVATGITSLPNGIAKLKKLKILWMYQNKLKKLPRTFSQLSNLEVLNLDNSQLAVFPDEITRLPALRRLYLGHNKITHLPPSIARLTRLKTLRIDNSLLRALPTELGTLIQLQNLDLSNNYLSYLPKELGRLKNLKILNLEDQHEQLRVLPETTGDLKNLERLNLEGNNIKVFPASLANLQRLNWLAIGGVISFEKRQWTSINYQQIIPIISKLPVEYLSLGNYKQKSSFFPKEIGEFKKLEYLNISVPTTANFKQLVEQLSRLETLEDLDIGCADEAAIPQEITKIKNLKRLRPACENRDKEKLQKRFPHLKVVYSSQSETYRNQPMD